MARKRRPVSPLWIVAVLAALAGILVWVSQDTREMSVEVASDEVTERQTLRQADVKDRLGEQCVVEQVCGDLAYVDCGEEVDLVSYFVEVSSGDIVSTCSRLCSGGDCECPPEAWQCEETALNERSLKEFYGEGCVIAEVCGDLAYVDCGAAADGPAYYVKTADGATISSCGGYPSGAYENCPPEQWTCR